MLRARCEPTRPRKMMLDRSAQPFVTVDAMDAAPEVYERPDCDAAAPLSVDVGALADGSSRGRNAQRAARAWTLKKGGRSDTGQDASPEARELGRRLRLKVQQACVGRREGVDARCIGVQGRLHQQNLREQSAATQKQARIRRADSA